MRELETLIAGALAHETHRDWYREAREACQVLFGDWRLFLRLLAATSPRMTVVRNTRAALECYRIVDATGRAPDEYAPLRCTMLTHLPNVARAVADEPLSGPKVSAFAANLLGDESVVTVDTHMLALFGRGTGNGRATKRQIRECQIGVELVAAAVGWTPAQTQAALWAFQRGDPGKRGACYATVLRDLGAYRGE